MGRRAAHGRAARDPRAESAAAAVRQPLTFRNFGGTPNP